MFTYFEYLFSRPPCWREREREWGRERTREKRGKELEKVERNRGEEAKKQGSEGERERWPWMREIEWERGRWWRHILIL